MTARKVTVLIAAVLVLLMCYPLQGFAQEDGFAKGLALINAREYDKAIVVFSELIDMIPGDVEAYNYRGVARAYQKDYDGAIADYTAALKIKPDYAEALHNRGFAWVKKGHLDRALMDFSRAIALDPRYLDAYNSKAWILATSADQQFRNGKEAVELAEKAVAIAETVDSLDTVAAAYAANGQFEQAIASQKKVIELVVRQDRTAEMDAYLDHLVKYKAHQPLRISYGTVETPVGDATEAKLLKAAAKEKKRPTVPQAPGTKKPAAPEKHKMAAARPPEATGNLGPLPYTIQVSAYRDSQKSIEVATRLKDNGDPAFTSPVWIPGKGQWHRVYIGFYQTLAEAQKAATRLKKRNFSYTEIVKKPLAVQVGMTDSYKDAREFKARLRNKGYMAYSLLDRKERKKTRILIGAYGSETEARQLIEQLQQDGYATQVLPR